MNDHVFPLATALRSSIRGYNLRTFRQDALSAFVVSLVALPLSMALAIAVGLPPQHGLYTAIVAGIVVPLLGGSIWQVSGPTAAFVVILAPIVSEFGLRGIIWAGALAGVMLLVMGFARLGRLINYVPYPVTTGFTAGIAVVLATLSLNDFLGLGIAKLEGDYVEKLSAIAGRLPSLDGYTFAVGAVSLLLMVTGGRLIRGVPSPITGVLAGTALAFVFAQMGHEVATIGSEFSYTALSGEVVPGVPPYPPALHVPTFEAGGLFTLPGLEELRLLLFPALAIAVLAALESLLSATVADSMAGTRHDPDAELNAIGIGNILSALAAGIPATGAIARTATNINSGARTPLASTLHAVMLALYILALAPAIRYMPMASLAALLMMTAYRMSHHKQFLRVIQIAPRSDVIVLLTCFLLTVFIDMVAGVGVGMVCAAFLLIKRVTELTQVEVETAADRTSAGPLPAGTMVYHIRGPLFFGTIEKAFDRYQFTHDYIDNFIVDMEDVPFIDMTGLVALKSMLASVAHEKRTVRIVCNTPAVADRIRRKISDHAVREYVHFHATLDEALQPAAKGTS